MLGYSSGWATEARPLKNMHNSAVNFIVVPLLGWMAVVSLLIVAYLASLEIEQRRRNRRMNQERHRLGLRQM
jgi:hypothetical protein